MKKIIPREIFGDLIYWKEFDDLNTEKKWTVLSNCLIIKKSFSFRAVEELKISGELRN